MLVCMCTYTAVYAEEILQWRMQVNINACVQCVYVCIHSCISSLVELQKDDDGAVAESLGDWFVVTPSLPISACDKPTIYCAALSKNCYNLLYALLKKLQQFLKYGEIQYGDCKLLFM